MKTKTVEEQEPDEPGQEPSQPLLDLAEVELRLGHRFRDRGLLENALQHSSYANEQPEALSNERLEFLGDAVLGLVVAELLFSTHEDWAEGDLSRAQQQLVDRSTLAQLARALELGTHLRLGRTELRSGGADKDTLLADAMESVIAAIYLDAGLEPVFEFLREAFSHALRSGDSPVERDPKSSLNEWSNARFRAFPEYRCVVDTGVDGAEDRFTSQVFVDGECWGEGCGRSKRLAEVMAAQGALERARELDAEEQDAST